MLFYISNKGGIGKNKVVHAIKLKYAFLLQDFDFIIITLASVIANNIDSSTIYTNLTINVKNRYKKSNTITNL